MGGAAAVSFHDKRFVGRETLYLCLGNNIYGRPYSDRRCWKMHSSTSFLGKLFEKGLEILNSALLKLLRPTNSISTAAAARVEEGGKTSVKEKD